MCKMPYKKIRIEREEIYQKVWTEPVSQVAKEFGLSDVGLAKICRRLNVPLPGVGYWQQKRAGYKVKKLPLPPLKADQQQSSVTIRVETSLPDNEQYADAKRMIDFEEKARNRIRVPSAPKTLHPLVAKTEKILRKASCDTDGLLNLRMENCLSIHVSPNTLDRSLRIMNALIQALESRNIKCVINRAKIPRTSVTIFGEVIDIGLDERLARTEYQPETEEEREQIERWWGGPRYVYVPTGRLVLRIKEYIRGESRKTWADGKKQRVENCLNDFIIGLVKLASYLRSRTLERERERLEREEHQRRYKEELKRKEAEEAKIQALLKEVDNWQRSQQIRSYLEVVKEKAIKKGDGPELESELSGWIQWAGQYADQIDPLIKE